MSEAEHGNDLNINLQPPVWIPAFGGMTGTWLGGIGYEGRHKKLARNGDRDGIGIECYISAPGFSVSALLTRRKRLIA